MTVVIKNGCLFSVIVKKVARSFGLKQKILIKEYVTGIMTRVPEQYG